jgi:transposase-like protein
MARRKRRQFSAEFKFEVVVELVRGEKSAAQLCREHDLTESLLSKWKQDFLAGGAAIFTRHDQTAAQSAEASERIAELERMVGKLTMQVEILKKASSVWESDWRRNGR